MPFDDSWLLPSSDKVDLVATNVASFPDRANPRASFSDPFMCERRALRIKASDHGAPKPLNDFIGKKLVHWLEWLPSETCSIALL